MKKRQKNWGLPAKVIGVFVVLFLCLYFAVVYAARAFKTSEYFKIQEVIGPANAEEFSYLKGRNIFTLDLNKEARRISEQFPVYKKIRLVRIFPNQIFIDFIKRRPLAYVKLYKYFYVDIEGALWDVGFAPTVADFDLPVIVGLETKIFGPKSGDKYNINQLNLALSLIDTASTHRILKYYKILKVDAKMPDTILVFLPVPLSAGKDTSEKSANAVRALEVKMNTEALNEKIDILGGLLIQLKNDLGNIQYLDLRFKDPVIKFKDAK